MFHMIIQAFYQKEQVLIRLEQHQQQVVVQVQQQVVVQVQQQAVVQVQQQAVIH